MHEGGHGRAGATALDERLAATVAPSARTVLVVGPGADRLAGVLAGRRPAPTVHVVDLDGDEPLLEAGSIDCIVYDDVLTRAADPLATLRRQRHLLSPTGTISCSVPNLQHHRVVSGLVRGVFPYTEGTLLDPAYRHLFTSASAVQMLLDAGYAPDTVDRIGDGGDAADAVAVAGAPLFELLGVGTKDADTDLSTSWMVLRGVPVPEPEPDDEVPLTFVACVNDDDQLGANLARSPCLRSGGPHELLVFRGCASAAEGLNAGIEQARHEFVVLVHQDVYLPERWPARMVAQWRRAERAGGPVGIGGVFGVLDRRVPFDAIGRVVHRDRLLSHRSLPADVDGLDELLMVVPRHTPLRVDADLGWHLYGTDLALQAQQRDLRVVVLDAPCHHNSLTGRVPSKYRHSERVLARKWEKMLPIHTNLSSIGSWLVEEADTDTAPDGADGAAGVAAPGAPAVAELVARLRREQVELGTELEQARLQVASMQASPFWRAREVYAALRSRLRPRR